jgi:hypothetical protein
VKAASLLGFQVEPNALKQMTATLSAGLICQGVDLYQ